MICTICKNGEMDPGRVTVTLQRNKSVIIIKNVPAFVYENCGEYTLSEAITNEIMQLAERAVANNAEIEVLHYAA